jgi:hypothetical protein
MRTALQEEGAILLREDVAQEPVVKGLVNVALHIDRSSATGSFLGSERDGGGHCSAGGEIIHL